MTISMATFTANISGLKHSRKRFPTRAFLQIGALLSLSTINAAPVHLVQEPPLKTTRIAPGVVLVDFGKVAFGNLRITPPPNETGDLTVHFGEASKNGRVDRKPPGSVRYSLTKLKLAGKGPIVVSPPVDKRNTKQPAAILTPPEWGTVTPFRWVEIEGWTGELRPEQFIRQAGFSVAWDDHAASFESSDETLNRIWELCRYSIKATTFAGIYVDGDRERIPYEADAYLNQLSHYATDNDVQMARDTFDRLMNYPTWPTEWAFHMILMAHADFMHTGDTKWLAPRYEKLKSKLLLERAGPDGLLVSNQKQIKRDDIVDWPRAERDGFIFKPINTVVNAFHIHSLKLMADLATALKQEQDAADYSARGTKALAAFQEKLFNKALGVYRDGQDTDHSSQHANLFPLAFGLVPLESRPGVIDFVLKRRMACSVYAAQYLLDGLFENEAGTQALALMTAPGDRSWRHMLKSGTTITWEAWDQKYKQNQDWNHAWGAAPANLLPSFVLGARPLDPGWTRTLIRPNTGTLKFASGKVPTPLGPVLVRWTNESTFKLSLTLPKGTRAKLELPASKPSDDIFVGGKQVTAKRLGSYWLLDEDVSGTIDVEVK
jgi:alpha-L-rhamnosidase